MFLVFIIMGGIAFWFLGREKTSSTINYDDMRFAQDPDQVYKIFLADREGHQTTLIREGDHWVYNDQYQVNPNVMENLLETIGGVRLQFIPTKKMLPHIIRDLATIGIKVELYNKENDLLKAYYVGGMTNDERGTYMIMEGSDNPYVTYLPALEGGLRWRYALRGDQWRDKTFIEADPGQLEEIRIEYPKQKSKSFILDLSEKDPRPEPMHATTPRINAPVRDGRISSFLTAFDKVVAEGFDNQMPTKDSIRQLVPFSIITYKEAGEPERTVRFFPIGANLTDPNTGAPLPVERYFADVNGEDFMLVQQRLVGKLFWSYESFFK